MPRHFAPDFSRHRPCFALCPAPVLKTLVLALCGALAPAAAWSQALDEQAIPLRLRLSRTSVQAAQGDGGRPALVLEAQKLVNRLDLDTVAEGQVRLRYGDLLMRAERVRYDQTTDLARAEGQVELARGGTLVRGPSLQLYLERFEGEMLDPQYFFSQTGGGGSATRFQFLDRSRISADGASYSSCPVDAEHPSPSWVLSTSKLSMDFDANEGVAKDAVLRFYGVPILAAPSLSFPLGESRKSGWLPPTINPINNRNGFELGLPYYWNIAPQRDATFTPFVMTQRGFGLDSEFRYLEQEHSGQIGLSLIPHDRQEGRSRWDLQLLNDGHLIDDWRYKLRFERVSDDDYWKDMPQRIRAVPERLLPADLALAKDNDLGWGQLQTYARVQRWELLEGLDPAAQFDAPYQRSPQIGLRLNSEADESVMGGFRPWGRRARLEGGLELEYNRFDHPALAMGQTQDMRDGQRLHMLAHLSLPLSGAAWWLIPKVSLNTATYDLDPTATDPRAQLGRSIPTFSLDHGWVLERETSLLGTPMLQSLEPRALYVRTPYRDQKVFPLFDTAPKDFNFDSIYTENQFTGMDRVNDANQLTLGVTSRWLNAVQGEEMLRLGLMQRFLFDQQRVTANDGPTITQKVSDVLLLGSAHLDPKWWLDGSVDYSPASGRTERSVLSARYAPGPFRTVSVAYRLARDQSEQLEVAWQWPLFGAAERPSATRSSSNSSCKGSWYSAGRVQYSLMDRKLSDSVVGFEYDAGCWILRVGAERLSAGLAQTNTGLLLQIELVGLSQLGANALKVLKDNIPGYRQLSSDRSTSSNAQYD